MGIIAVELMFFIITVLLLGLYLSMSKKYHWFDSPDEQRKLHTIAKPTSAGLIFMMPVLLLAFALNTYNHFASFSFSIGLLVVLLLGGFDDFKPLSAKIRLVVLFIIAIIQVYNLPVNQGVNQFLLFAFYVVGLMWWINLFNFMDGIDGMVTLHAIITVMGYFLAFYVLDNGSLIMAFYLSVFLLCLIAFLFFNFPRSKMFMGDSGSLSVSFTIGYVALTGISMHTFNELFVLFFHLIFIIDATLTLFYRIKYKHSLAKAHSLHAFQSMVKAGRSHAKISSVYAFITFISVVMAMFFAFYKVPFSTQLMFLIIETVILVIFWYKNVDITKFQQNSQ